MPTFFQNRNGNFLNLIDGILFGFPEKMTFNNVVFSLIFSRQNLEKLEMTMMDGWLTPPIKHQKISTLSSVTFLFQTSLKTIPKFSISSLVFKM